MNTNEESIPTLSVTEPTTRERVYTDDDHHPLGGMTNVRVLSTEPGVLYINGDRVRFDWLRAVMKSLKREESDVALDETNALAPRRVARRKVARWDAERKWYVLTPPKEWKGEWSNTRQSEEPHRARVLDWGYTIEDGPEPEPEAPAEPVPPDALVITERALVSSDQHGDGAVLWHAGASLHALLEGGDESLTWVDIGLDNAPHGLSVWEGTVDTADWSNPKLHGVFRALKPDEWKAVIAGQHPWADCANLHDTGEWEWEPGMVGWLKDDETGERGHVYVYDTTPSRVFAIHADGRTLSLHPNDADLTPDFEHRAMRGFIGCLVCGAE